MTNHEQFQMAKAASGIIDVLKNDPLTASVLGGGAIGGASALLSKNDADDMGERPINKLLRRILGGGAVGLGAGFAATRGNQLIEHLQAEGKLPTVTVS